MRLVHALIRLACQNHGLTLSEPEHEHCGHNEQYVGNGTGVYSFDNI